MVKDLQVVGEVINGEQLLEILCGMFCEVVLLDIFMFGVNGFEVILWICVLNELLVILVLLMYDEVQMVVCVLKIGVVGYVIKDSDLVLLFIVICRVVGGGCYIDLDFVDWMVFEVGLIDLCLFYVLFFECEFLVFEWLVQGVNVNEIVQ